MSEENSYKLFESDENEYHLKPCTFGLYEKLKLAQLKCTAIPATAKRAIIAEFNLSEKDVGNKSEYGLQGLYEFIVKNIVMDPPSKIDIKDLNIGEMNRATNAFFG